MTEPTVDQTPGAPTQPHIQQTASSPLAASNLQSSLLRTEHLLFGTLGDDAYPAYAAEQIKQTFGTVAAELTEAQKQRVELWERYDQLTELVKQFTNDPLCSVRSFMLSNSALALKELPQGTSGLGLHLKEIQQFCQDFLLLQDGASRFPNILNDRQAQLMANLIAPLHDLLKYLGTPKAQIMADHEILTAELVRHTFLGKVFELNGAQTTLSAEDCKFIADVVGDHENIFKEAGRSAFIRSADPVERAKGVFFVADVLTGVIVFDRQSGNWTIDEAQLKTRFVDLYFRHIDPEKGKVFRPEWGLSALSDISNTLGALNREGLNLDPTALKRIAEGALSAVQQALDTDNARATSFFTRETAVIHGREVRAEDGGPLGMIEQVKTELERLIAG